MLTYLGTTHAEEDEGKIEEVRLAKEQAKQKEEEDKVATARKTAELVKKIAAEHIHHRTGSF